MIIRHQRRPKERRNDIKAGDYRRREQRREEDGDDREEEKGEREKEG